MNKPGTIKLTKEQIDSSTERRARSINNPEITQNRELLTRISNLMFVLEFFRMPPGKVTSSPDYIEEVTDLQALVKDIQNSLELIKNTLYANLSKDEDGSIERTDLNISNLSGNVENAVARLMRTVKGNPLSKLQSEQIDHPLPPPVNGLDSRDRQTLKRVLEELRVFLHNFITRNKIDILHSTTVTANDLASAQDDLEMLQRRGEVEEAFDESFSKRLDMSWNTALAKLALSLKIFEGKLDGIFKENAEQLMIMTDENTVSNRIVADAEQEAAINKKIERKDKITSLLPVRFAISAFSYVTGRKMLPWSSPERKTRDALSARIKKYSDYIKQRRRIIQTRNAQE